MSPWKFLLSSVLSATFAIQPALAAGQGGTAIEIVTFKLKAGIAATEFAPIGKAAEREHVARQPGFVSRESAHGADGADGEWLVIVHWRSAKDADASMASLRWDPGLGAGTLRQARHQRADGAAAERAAVDGHAPQEKRPRNRSSEASWLVSALG